MCSLIQDGLVRELRAPTGEAWTSASASLGFSRPASSALSPPCFMAAPAKFLSSSPCRSRLPSASSCDRRRKYGVVEVWVRKPDGPAHHHVHAHAGWQMLKSCTSCMLGNDGAKVRQCNALWCSGAQPSALSTSKAVSTTMSSACVCASSKAVLCSGLFLYLKL